MGGRFGFDNKGRSTSRGKKHIKNENMIRHMLATEAAMKKLAQYFNEDVELWD